MMNRLDSQYLLVIVGGSSLHVKTEMGKVIWFVVSPCLISHVEM